MGRALDAEERLNRIKEIVAEITGLDLVGITDDASLQRDLKIDELTRLEIWVEVGMAFRLDFEHFVQIDSVRGMHEMVERRLAEQRA